MTLTERVAGCLQGIATGDAIGKQSENLSADEVRQWYPAGIRGFEGDGGATMPRFLTNKKRRWRFGETTDDTERTLAVARAIIVERAVSHAGVGREMLGCVKSVHPGVPSLWEFHQADNAAYMASTHDGCGAAVRVAPVGVLYPSSSISELVDGAWEASVSTHAGTNALAAAAATAAAISAAIDGGGPERVLAAAFRAITLAESRWGASGSTFADAVREVRSRLMHLPALQPDLVASSVTPTSTRTIVPLALNLATLMASAQEAILLAANIGGDSDSVASIAGGILGATYPQTVNREWVAVVEQVNHHDLLEVSRKLAATRLTGT